MIEEGLLLPMNVLLQGQKLTLLDPEMWFLREMKTGCNPCYYDW